MPFAAFQDPHLEKAASPRIAAGTAGITLDENFDFVVFTLGTEYVGMVGLATS